MLTHARPLPIRSSGEGVCVFHDRRNRAYALLGAKQPAVSSFCETERPAAQVKEILFVLVY
jgi:hypothetical protein